LREHRREIRPQARLRFPWPSVRDGGIRSPISSTTAVLMASPQIERELAAAGAAIQAGNDGKARVCARRAVGLAAEAWLARHQDRQWRGDAMEYLRQIQQDAIFPASIREAAERLSTPVPKQHEASFTADPIADAKLIIAHLTASK